MTLRDLKIGESAVIRTVGGEGALRQHFLDMGVIPGAEVTVVKFAPMGDPMELQIHCYELTLRLADAKQIEVEPIDSRSRRHESAKGVNNTVHPGLGEDGNIMSRRMRIHCRIPRFLHMLLSVTRTAARRHFLTSLPAPTSMSVISRELRLTERTAR